MKAYRINHRDGSSAVIDSNSKYCLKYKVGEITTARPETLGVFCFKTERDADCSGFEGDLFEVEGIGEPVEPKYIGGISENDLDMFYRNPDWWYPLILEIICFPAVKVIRKIKGM